LRLLVWLLKLRRGIMGEQIDLTQVNHIKLEVRDRNGILVQLVFDEAHSFTRNFFNLMVNIAMDVPLNDATTFGDGFLNMKRTDGVVVITAQITSIRGSGAAGAEGEGYRESAGQDAHGVLVGTSNQAFSFEDFDLIAQIADGTGAGQMSHTLVDAYSPTWAGGTKKWTTDIVRFFNNNSGGAIVVEEAALVTESTIGGTTNQQALLSRDLTGTVSIPDGGQLKVTYSLVSPAFPS